MAIEIELKAHVENYDELKLLLKEKAEYLYAFEKEDNYWKGADLPKSGLRLRSEKRTHPDGTEESVALATYKFKEVREGIEVNDEREFSVDSAAQLENLLKLLALQPCNSKQKIGWAFTHKGITAELLEVKGLGWFLELEITGINAADSNSNENFAEGKKRLLDFLDSLDIKREAIESRFYMEMLREN
ncbi:MAG: class IV adenylate cyclase [Treponema sp.]|jgi:adenylate cyclase class 2|nr:class IV adenylate cyclase [Treponema sp.]